MESLLGGLLNFDFGKIYGNIKDSKGRPTNVRHTRRHLFFFFIYLIITWYGCIFLKINLDYHITWIHIYIKINLNQNQTTWIHI